RLVEGADEILAGLDIDPGLAADRAVDLGEQGGRDLDEMAAALDDRRGEAGQVADHAAAEGKDMVAPLDAELEQPVDQRGKRLPALAALAGRQQDRRRGDPVAGESVGELPALERPHRLVADDDE